MRVLAIAALVFAFAQPYFPSSTKEASKVENVIAIHIDNSFSMTMRGAEGELLSEAIETARRILIELPLDSKVILTTNAMNGIESRITTKLEALNRLDDIEPSVMKRNYEAVIQWQNKFVANHPTVAGSAIQHIFLSDFQKQLFHAKELIADSINTYSPFVFTPQDISNLSIDSVWFASPLHKLEGTNELNIKVTNHGKDDLQNLEMTVLVGELKKDLFFDIKGSSSTTNTVSINNKQAGTIEGKVQLADNQFYADDDYYFTYQVREKSSVLILNGDDFEPSVSKVYALDEFYQVATINIQQYTQDVLKDVDLIVLNGVNEIPSGITSNLIDFTSTGGSIALFPGASIDYGSVNNFLASFELPIFSNLTKQNGRIQKLNYEDPFFTGVFDEEKDNLSLPGVSEFYITNLTASSRSLPVIQLQNGQPLLYRTDGNQQVFVFASILGKDHGSFVNDILYPTTLLRISELSQRTAPLQLTLGTDANFPIYEKQISESPIHLKTDKIDYIPQLSTVAGVRYLQLKGDVALENLNPGIYSIQQENKEIGRIALNLDRAESDINYFTLEEVQNVLKAQGINSVGGMTVNDGVSNTDISISKPKSSWKIFVVIALLALLGEMIIIKFWKIQHN